MKYNQYKFETNVWLYPGMVGWHFASVPQNISEDIKQHFGDRKRGGDHCQSVQLLVKQVGGLRYFPTKNRVAIYYPLRPMYGRKKASKQTAILHYC